MGRVCSTSLVRGPLQREPPEGREITMTTTTLAQVLFASALQSSDNPSPAQVRTAIDHQLCAGDPSRWAAYVAQEAGDHPDCYASRMRWALTTVHKAYDETLLVAA